MFMFLKTAASHEMSILKDVIERRNKPFERMLFGNGGQYLKERYALHILDGVEDVNPVVTAFYKSYEWTLSYFLENKVPDWNWVYPYADAPLLGYLMDVKMVERPTFDEKLTFKTINQLQCTLS
jgi:5'-3' exonuclease